VGRLVVLTVAMLTAWPFDAIDPFAGPGGWSEGLRALGLRDLGIELDAAACATRYANGHASWHADVEQVDPSAFAGVAGLIASPPCPDWSAAGSRLGRDGASGYLVDVVPRWVEQMRPEWIACEQVPGALPVWREHAHRYRELGYSTWCGVLNAADFGVPQTRRRAILMASRVRSVGPPPPTHSRTPGGSMFDELLPWVSMADALGWGADGSVDRRTNSKGPGWRHGGGMVPTAKVGTDRPAPTLTTKAGGQWVLGFPRKATPANRRTATASATGSRSTDRRRRSLRRRGVPSSSCARVARATQMRTAGTTTATEPEPRPSR